MAYRDIAWIVRKASIVYPSPVVFVAGKGISGVLPLFLALPASGFDCKFAIDLAIVSLVKG